MKLFGISAFFIALNMLFAPLAAAEAVFTAKNIAVDKTASSASEARSLAILEGQRRGFKALLRKITPISYHAELPELDDTELTSMVSGVQVSNEKTSAQRYLANLTFEFRRNLILPILEARNIPYSEITSKPILVLPIFENEGQKNLWDEPNPWRDAWIDIYDNGRGPEGNQKRSDDWAQEQLLPVLVPAGTLEDIKTVAADDAIYLREEPLKQLMDAYGAGAVLVAYASLQNQNGIRRLDISYQRSDLFTPAVVESFTGGDTDEEIFRAAIFDVVSNLQEGWKDQNILDRNIENKLAISTSIKTLKDWITIKQRTETIPAIQLITVKEMSVENVFWEVSFVGGLDQLKTALLQKSLVLDNEEGFWTLNLK